MEYRLHPEDYVRNGNSVSLTVSDLVIRRGEESFQLNQKLELPIKPVGQELTDFYLTTIYGKSMDKVLGDTYDERLWIAKIHLIRQKHFGHY